MALNGGLHPHDGTIVQQVDLWQYQAASEFEHPGKFYFIGKDSSVMGRLAEKAFYTGKLATKES